MATPLLHTSSRLGCCAVVLLALLATFAAGAASAAAAPAEFDGSSADGKIVVFSTKDKLVPGDTDGETDAYARAFDPALGEYVTRELSIGPHGGNDAQPAVYDGMSWDGNEVFFSTRERLLASDTDHAEDIYERILSENRTVLVSQGAGPSQGTESCAATNCGNREIAASFVPDGVAIDGGRVFFETSEALTESDKDEALDVYVRNLAAGTTELVSAPEAGCGVANCGNGPATATFLGTDDAGDKAYFSTTEAMTGEDTDASQDIYQRDLTAKTTSLVSIAGTCPPTALTCTPAFSGVSADGSHVFFESSERLVPEDSDESQDVYGWSEDVLTLVSTGADGGNGPYLATYSGTTSDGTSVYFQTRERLEPTVDTDEAQDVYVRSGGTTTLVSAGAAGFGNAEVPAEFEWAAPDGSSVIFTTAEPMVAADSDQSVDVYERSGGVTTLISTGAGAPGGEFNARFAGASENGSKVFFLTAEPISPEDLDTSIDLYRYSTAGTELLSLGTVGGNGNAAVEPDALSADGSRVFFATTERLTAEDDFAGEKDIYERGPVGTVMVSVGNSPELVLGPSPPILEATDPASPGASTTPTIIGQSGAGTDVKIYANATCNGEPVAQGSAAELAAPGLTVTVPVLPGSTTGFRATAEADGIVSPCSGALVYVQREPVAAPPGGGEGGGGESPAPGGGTAGGSGSGGSSSTGTTGRSAAPGSPGHGAAIVYATPLPRITFAPAAKTRLRRPIFHFADATGQPGTRFFCRLDKRHWRGCGSPDKLPQLALGKHVFSVKAVNAIGIAAPKPVTRKFRVVKP